MISKKTILNEYRELIHLAWPLIMNLLAYMAMQLVDTLMLGRLGPLALASSVLGGVVYIIIVLICIGLLSPIGILTAQAVGEKDKEKVEIISRQGLWITLILSVPSMLVIWFIYHLLFLIKQPPDVVLGARDFLHGLFWGFFPGLGYVALREVASALSKPRIVMIIALLAIPINAVINYILMYGKLGIPALHIYGVGLATSVVDWLIFFALAFYIAIHPSFKKFKIFHFEAPRFSYLKEIFYLGLPIGINFGIEEGLFVVTALLIGYFGVTALAAHQIAIQCMTFAVMIPIGIAQATAIRVSHALGREEYKRAIRAAYFGVTTGLVIAFLVAICFWFLPTLLVSLFLNIHESSNQPVTLLAVKLLAIIAIFHIMDAVQLITNGALRGYQDTYVPMLLGLVSFWVFGIGSGILFGFKFKWGVIGLWWGLALGITASAILLQLRLLAVKRAIRNNI